MSYLYSHSLLPVSPSFHVTPLSASLSSLKHIKCAYASYMHFLIMLATFMYIMLATHVVWLQLYPLKKVLRINQSTHISYAQHFSEVNFGATMNSLSSSFTNFSTHSYVDKTSNICKWICTQNHNTSQFKLFQVLVNAELQTFWYYKRSIAPVLHSCCAPPPQNGECFNTGFNCLPYGYNMYLYHTSMKTINLVPCDHHTPKHTDYFNI